jgi:glucosamine--fructose-6-phosphate aminotransferase (isomerizing)
MGDINLVFPSAQEESVAQTRAFTTLFLATAALAALWHGDEPSPLWDELQRLPPILRRLLDRYEETLLALGADLGVDRFYMLGSEVRYGLACEISLKMKEMTLSHSEPFYTMEFRHGPKSMVTPSTLIIGLLGPGRRRLDEAVLREMAGMGARTLTVAEDDADVAFESGLSELAQSLLFVPVGQLIALSRSLVKGLNPDRPNNLSTVVFLDEAA